MERRGGTKRVLVVFPDDWAPFSPTLTRLVDLLSKRFEVKVLAFDTGRFDLGVLDARRYVRVALPTRRAALLRRIGLLRIVRTLLLASRARGCGRWADQIVAVDADGATACWMAGLPMHYLSLEVERPSLARWIVPYQARSIAIQSRERLEYQFPPGSIDHLPVFLIQNAPEADAFDAVAPVTRDLERPRLVYMGNLIPGHGLFRMLDLLHAWPEASLTLRGIVPDACMASIRERAGDLLDAGRLRVESGYLRDEDIPRFLTDYDIGLCLYEPTRGDRLDFNYESAPAGKMFNYFAAGLPVLASDLLGLRPVTEYRAGIQARSNAPADLLDAGQALCADHPSYREGALRAARAFDFAASAGAFAGFLASAGERT